MKPPYLFPTFKGRETFWTWCFDCIVGLPATSGGETVLIVVVCAWSKWIEYKPVLVLTSKATTTFLYELITRFGVPAVMKYDMGTECLGAFD